jgi:acetyl-CoA synthetase
MGRFRLRNRVVEAPEPDALFPVPARFNFTRDVVEAAASADAFRPAMTFVDHEGIIDRLTYREIAHEASRWTSLFRSRGLVAGDRVAVLVGRTPLWHGIVLGALKGGFVVVPCPESFDADELTQRSAHCDARATVTDRAHAPSAPEVTEDGDSEGERPEPHGLLIVEDLKEELRGLPVEEPTHETVADDPAFILYTAGTSGAPKGTLHTHASTWMMRLQAEHWLGARPDDLVWCTAETGSALFVWNALIGPWSVGSEIAMHERTFDVDERFDLIGRLGATVLCQPPSEYRRMARHPELEQFYLGSIRHAVSTGAPLDSETVDAFRVTFGITIHDAYGQAETGILVANRRESEVGAGSLGEPLPGYDIAVLDERGNEQAVGVEGEIALRGQPPSLFTGYWNDPDRTEAVFLDDWYLPGDRVTRDSDGCLWFAGRGDGQNAVRLVEQERAAEVEAAAAAEAEVARKEAAAAAAAAAAAEQRRRQEEEDVAERARRESEERARAAAEARRREEEREAREAAEQALREEAERGAAAEAQRLEEERARAADDAQRRDEQEAIAEAAAVATELDRNVGASAASHATVEPPAPAKQSRREAAAARRAAKADAKKAEQQRKRDEKRRREEEKAAAEQARRDEAEAKRAAETKAREDEQQRKRDEKRRREEEKAAAQQARRDEAEAKRAAETKAREDEQQRKREKEQERKQAASATATTALDPPDPTDEDDARISAELIARLRAYGHGDDNENATKDQE